MEIKREALSRRDDARIKLNKAKDELANLKSEEVIVSNDHLEDYATQAYDDDDDECEEDNFLTLKTKFKEEYESRNAGGKKRKALPEKEASSPIIEKKQKTGWFMSFFSS